MDGLAIARDHGGQKLAYVLMLRFDIGFLDNRYQACAGASDCSGIISPRRLMSSEEKGVMSTGSIATNCDHIPRLDQTPGAMANSRVG